MHAEGNKVHLIISLITHRRLDSDLPRDIILTGCWCLEGTGKSSMGFSSGAKKASNSHFFKATPDSGLLSFFFFFFLCGSFLKSFLNLLQYCFCFMFWFFGPEVCRILSS